MQEITRLKTLGIQKLILFLCLLAGMVCVTFAMSPLNKTECLEWHNIYRAIHQTPSLNWSDTLAARAQLWADDLANRDAFEHDSSRGMEGENLYKSSIDSPTACKSGTYAFYKEEQYYDYDNPGFSVAVGHFTQVVWVDSRELGVAKANTSSGAIILVYRYSPTGNIVGEFADNVRPPLGDASTYTRSLFINAFTFCSVIAINLHMF
ncbi:Golgi-associated plant pathogenesis-related protein 1-like [Dendronephthya gigantea]|uniref:Golgi-associated plant pathogenesis-related protein 1-like n=1 Tax=Dendronephthya gigantea TaxID=151771 RepID=UPI00106AD845|nr:Golgi-associated plant pathogenesis-related protein 1-like [Dendronephthya gigantea]